jgi:hypothetical protein
LSPFRPAGVVCSAAGLELQTCNDVSGCIEGRVHDQATVLTCTSRTVGQKLVLPRLVQPKRSRVRCKTSACCSADTVDVPYSTYFNIPVLEEADASLSSSGPSTIEVHDNPSFGILAEAVWNNTCNHCRCYVV